MGASLLLGDQGRMVRDEETSIQQIQQATIDEELESESQQLALIGGTSNHMMDGLGRHREIHR